METLRRNGLKNTLLMFVFTKFNNSFFKEQHSVTAYGFLNELQGDLLHRVPVVYKQDSI